MNLNKSNDRVLMIYLTQQIDLAVAVIVPVFSLACSFFARDASLHLHVQFLINLGKSTISWQSTAWCTYRSALAIRAVIGVIDMLLGVRSHKERWHIDHLPADPRYKITDQRTK